jgi:hypothetical protein
VVEIEPIDDRNLDRARWVFVRIVHIDSLSRSGRGSVRDCLGVSGVPTLSDTSDPGAGLGYLRILISYQ